MGYQVSTQIGIGCRMSKRKARKRDIGPLTSSTRPPIGVMSVNLLETGAVVRPRTAESHFWCAIHFIPTSLIWFIRITTDTISLQNQGYPIIYNQIFTQNIRGNYLL